MLLGHEVVALVSIVDCVVVVVVLLLLIKMVCSGCGSVVFCAYSDACAFTLGLRGDVAVRSRLLLRSSGAGARSVEPGVLFGDVCAVERGKRVLRKRGMLVCMANEGRNYERTWQICSTATGL